MFKLFVSFSTQTAGKEMDKSKLLSPEQVIETFNKKSSKEFLDKFLSLKDDAQLIELNEGERQNYIEQKIDEQFDVFTQVNVKSIDCLGVLEWLCDRNESVVLRFKNKPQFMGRSEKGKIYLNAEETLFLIDTSSVVCYYKNLQLSLQDAFGLMSKDDLEYERYIVYSYLLRFGYRVRRASAQNDVKERVVSKKDFKDDSFDEKLINTEDENIQNEDLIKRSIDVMTDFGQPESKKIKLNVEQTDLRSSIKIIKLDELIQNLHSIDENNELEFMKFIRFSKLNKIRQHNNWKELIDNFNDRKENKSAILIQGIDESVNFDVLKEDQKTRVLYEDFFVDAPLINLNDSLSEDEIQSRLAQFGPQLDLSDSLLDDSQISNHTVYDYDVYLPNRKQKIQNTQPDYCLKILHSNQHSSFPFDEIFYVNSRIPDRRKLLFVICQSNELNFYQFTDVNLIHYH